MKKLMSERGAINIQGLMMMGIGMIFLAVCFIIYPIILDGVAAIFDWVDPTTLALTYEDFTGLGAIAGILPLIVLLGVVVSAVVAGIMGVKSMRGSATSMGPRETMMLGIGIIFIAVGLIIFPVIMDGVATALEAVSLAAGDFTGLEAILYVTPLICLTGFLVGGIVASFFGAKTGYRRSGRRRRRR